MFTNGIIATDMPMLRGASQPSPWAAVDLPVTDAPEAPIYAMNQVLKPYVLLACVAFVIGFASYLALGSVMVAPAQARDEWQATISVPAPPADARLAKGKLI